MPGAGQHRPHPGAVELEQGTGRSRQRQLDGLAVLDLGPRDQQLVVRLPAPAAAAQQMAVELEAGEIAQAQRGHQQELHRQGPLEAQRRARRQRRARGRQAGIDRGRQPDQAPQQLGIRELLQREAVLERQAGLRRGDPAHHPPELLEHRRRGTDMVAGDRLQMGGEAMDLRGRPVAAAGEEEAQDRLHGRRP